MITALILALVAVAVTLVFFLVRHLLIQIRDLDRERKRLFNKLLIREGHAQLFPDAEIEPDADRPERKKASIGNVTSPFRKKIVDLRASTEAGKKEVPGSTLPPEIKNRISKAAEEQRNGNGAS